MLFLNYVLIATWIGARALIDRTTRLVDDRGEGVISAAIAVLVMAFLGALMWVGFKALFQEAQGNIHTQVSTIGS